MTVPQQKAAGLTANGQVIEELYEEALCLADEARHLFDQARQRVVAATGSPVDLNTPGQIALSIEGLKTTTRIMHVLAWLLNQRAFLSGELTWHQLDRHGALPDARGAEEGQLRLLDLPTQTLIATSERLYDRIARLDRQQRQPRGAGDAAKGIASLHDRLHQAFEAA